MAYAAIVVALAALSVLGAALYFRLGALPTGGQTLTRLSAMSLPAGNDSTSVHLVRADLDRFPLLAVTLDALVDPGAYANVTRNQDWVHLPVEEDQRELVRGFLVTRFQAEYGDAPFPHTDHLLEVYYCGDAQHGQFCGYALLDFAVSP